MGFTPPNEKFVRPGSNRACSVHMGSPVDIGHPMGGPNHRFDVNDAKMVQPPAAREPGTGAIPVSLPAPGLPTSMLRPRR
jgi:hypothetical protein